MAIRNVLLFGENPIPCLLYVVERERNKPHFRLFPRVASAFRTLRGELRCRRGREEQQKTNRPFHAARCTVRIHGDGANPAPAGEPVLADPLMALEGALRGHEMPLVR